MTREKDAAHMQLARQVGGAIACLLVIALLLGLTACGGGQEKQPQAEPPAVTTAPEPDQPEPVKPPEPVPAEPDPEPLPPVDEDEHDGFPEAEEDDEPLPAATHEFTQEDYDKAVSDVLDSIIRDDMTAMEQAKAVFDYVHNNIRYIGSSDKSDWMNGAYAGLTAQKGDCFTYYAVSRALLTALEIDNLEVQRLGGKTHHYWNLVNCGDGWYHFDACPRNIKMPSFNSFMVTDEQIAAFTAMAGRNYYDFDGSLLPERATEIVTNTRPIPRPVEPEEEDPEAEDPNAENPEEFPDEPQLPPDDLTEDPNAVTDPPADQTAPGEDVTVTDDPDEDVTVTDDPGENAGAAGENGEEVPTEIWTEPPAEEWTDPALGGENSTENTGGEETEAG